MYPVVPTTYHKMKGESRAMYKISKRKLCMRLVQAGLGSYKELSKASGVSINTISRSNNGGTVKLATLRKLALALNVDPSELLEEV